MDEFELIDAILAGLGERASGPGVVIGPGDDCAVLRPPPGHDLVISTDTLAAGRHFPTDLPAAAVGQRAMGVNLSDLAAMGANAWAAVVALTTPDGNPDWLGACARGIAAAARESGCAIVGGNLCRGALSVTITVHGLVPEGCALLRRGAHLGDDLWVSGSIGLAASGLARIQAGSVRVDAQPCIRGALPADVERFVAPQARLTLGLALRGIATACIDISDGLLAETHHLLRASGVGVQIDLDAVPVAAGFVDDPLAAMAAGDDYELLFTAPADARGAVIARAAEADTAVARIGRIVAGAELRLLRDGATLAPDNPPRIGYRHF